ncbi:Chitin synthase regulatory factor 3 [Grifola frondosa]|uniref:Chitin synthase regulatory factor 3 n=1 Tax=Grifola frondosa TaxID=5627 RepID=A0A1C7MEF8_GRIFR|nr:Chitin synthase regulatory factor 3 [Grifola frondosa]
MRPPLQRSGTMASVTLRTRKTKAIDLSAPPYTKDYIDQYRIRIKDDPDPEAHFLYAKYLIDAAKKIGADAKDQRSVRKYRDTLIAESLKVIRRLATQGEPYDEAQFFLANCHGSEAKPRCCLLSCRGLQRDRRRDAKRAAARSCLLPESRIAGRHRRNVNKLGVILLRGSLGQQPNPREAVGWLKRAAEQADEENPHALHELALLHEAPNSQVVLHDPAYARELYARAGHLGYTHSQFRLGQCYEFGTLTCPVDPRRSIAWYTKAAERGHSEAELALSGWYLTGSEGVLKQSDSEAYLWARRAANKGLSKAEYAVGYYAEVGIGIKQDVEFAKRWYMRAAAQGNKRAMNRLTEMKRNGNKRANMARPTRQEAKDECVIV